jgi:hypothetical protein
MVDLSAYLTIAGTLVEMGAMKMEEVAVSRAGNGIGQISVTTYFKYLPWDRGDS